MNHYDDRWEDEPYADEEYYGYSEEDYDYYDDFCEDDVVHEDRDEDY